MDQVGLVVVLQKRTLCLQRRKVAQEQVLYAIAPA